MCPDAKKPVLFVRTGFYRIPSMGGQFCVGAFEDCQLIDQFLASGIQARYFHFIGVFSELQHDAVDGTDAGIVPNMGIREIDDHFLAFDIEVEFLQEILNRSEEQLAFNAVLCRIEQTLFHFDLGNFRNEENSTQ